MANYQVLDTLYLTQADDITKNLTTGDLSLLPSEITAAEWENILTEE